MPGSFAPTVSYSEILVTGGAGFVGSNLAIRLKTRFPTARVTALDNLRRRGSELNLPRLAEAGVTYVHGDIRNAEDLAIPGRVFDLIVECSAEPSVLAGLGGDTDYVINTNLAGTIRCLEVARRCKSDFVFLSTSRVYPVATVNAIETIEDATRLRIDPVQSLVGASERGIDESFATSGARSLYGATKLASELFIEEYAESFGLRYVIDRCGVITGPWQMGKVDQGVFALWMAMHYFKQPLKYIGWNGTGKQVRDLVSIDDLGALIESQLEAFDRLPYRLFNVGGGQDSSLSLLETTALCAEITGNHVPVTAVPENRPSDLKLYITDNSRVTDATGWRPRKTAKETLTDIFTWIHDSEDLVRRIWAN
jgi:CDP-paratose 2-epimerase